MRYITPVKLSFIRYLGISLISILLVACNEGDSGIDLEGSANIQGIAQLGFLQGSSVKIYNVSDLETPLATTDTLAGGNVGEFNFSGIKLETGEYYLLAVSGGKDVDANDDGNVGNEQSVDLKGTVHALATMEELKVGIRVNVLTDLLYRKIKHDVDTLNFTNIQAVIGGYVKEYTYDINSDAEVNNLDLLAFNPITDKSKLKKSYAKILQTYIPALHANKSEAHLLTSLLLMDEPKIHFEKGSVQEVPFEFSAEVLGVPNNLDVKWFLDDKEVTRGYLVDKEGAYQVSARIDFEGSNVSIITEMLLGIKTVEVRKVDISSSKITEVYISDEDSTSLAGTKITIPEGAISEAVSISINSTSINEIPNTGGTAISDVLIMEPSGLKFDKPIVISLPYTGEPNNSIRIARYSEGVLDYLTPLFIDTENKNIIFETDHFSMFQADTDVFGQSADELFIDQINDFLGMEKDIDEWKEILNQTVSGDSTVYDLAKFTLDNSKMNSYIVSDSNYIKALEVLYPNTASYSAEMNRWSDIEGGFKVISLVQNVGGAAQSIMKGGVDMYLFLFDQLKGELEAHSEFKSTYSPSDIGGSVIRNFINIDNNQKIKGYVAVGGPFDSSVDFFDEYLSGRGIKTHVDSMLTRLIDYSEAESKNKLKALVEAAQKQMIDKENPYSVVSSLYGGYGDYLEVGGSTYRFGTDIGNSVVFSGEKFSANIIVTNHGYERSQYSPEICIYKLDSSEEKIVCHEATVALDENNEFWPELDFDAPFEKGKYEYKIVFSFGSEKIIKKFEIEVKDKEIANINDISISDGFKENGDYYYFNVYPVFDDYQIGYTTHVDIPGIGEFSAEKITLTKEQFNNIDLSGVKVVFDPLNATYRTAERKEFIVDFNEVISKKFNDSSINADLVLYKHSGPFDLSTATGENKDIYLNLNDSDKVIFSLENIYLSNEKYSILYFSDGINSVTDKYLNYKYIYEHQFHVEGVYKPSVRIKDNDTGKEKTIFFEYHIIAEFIFDGEGSCVGPWNTLPSGASIDAYQSATVPAGSECLVENRLCTNGDLSGSYTEQVCKVDSVVVTPSAKVTSVSPQTSQANTLTIFTIMGENFPSTVTAQIQGANCPEILKFRVSDTHLQIQCQHAIAETLVLSTVSGSGGEVITAGSANITFTALLVDVATKVTSVSPQTSQVNSLTTFTITGENFPSTVTAQIQGADCPDNLKVRISETQLQIQCQHTVAETLVLTTVTASGGSLLTNGSSNITFTTIDSSSLPVVTGFDYPIGDRGFSAAGEYKILLEQITEEKNIYSTGAGTLLANHSRTSTGFNSTLWRNASDVGNYLSSSVTAGLHPGEDWNLGTGNADAGEAVYAIAEGQVDRIQSTYLSGYSVGAWVMVLKHKLSNGDFIYSHYMHITSADQTLGAVVTSANDFTLSVGDIVQRGQLIARLASGTEMSAISSAHLHFEMQTQAITGSDLLPNDNGNGYYTNDDSKMTSGMTVSQINETFTQMKAIGIIDPSDYIEKNRISPHLLASTNITGISYGSLVKGATATFTVTGSNLPASITFGIFGGSCGTAYDVSTVQVSVDCDIPNLAQDSYPFYIAAYSGGDSLSGAESLVADIGGADTTAPVISLNGSSSITLIKGTPYIELGATANDAVDGVLTVTLSGTVDENIVNQYTITYTATDIANNTVTLDRTVNVVLTLPVSTSKLNDTGITWSGNYPSGNNATCVGTEVDKQDCSHGRDAQAAAGTLTKIGAGAAGFDFTKLDSSGNTLPASASSWSCVKDNHTGLIWEAKTTDGGIHDASNTYRWGGLTAQGRDHASTGIYYDDWNTLIEGSNNNSLCGLNSGWRVPNRYELRSIVHLGYSPKIDGGYFPMMASFVWSSSLDAGYPPHAWGINFRYGRTYDLGRDMYQQVKLVRSGQ